MSIAQTKSFSTTAVEMNISQSSVSKQLRVLESELEAISQIVVAVSAGGQKKPAVKMLLPYIV